MHTQVGIIGAGPAGLFLSHLLALTGIESVVLEAKSRSYVEGRIRAGVLEDGTARLLRETGVGARMDREGLKHDGLILRFAGHDLRIDLQKLTGKSVMVYGQHEVVKDLIAQRLHDGGVIEFDAPCHAIEDFSASGKPVLNYTKDGVAQTLSCDIVVACDGFHGLGRAIVKDDARQDYDRIYPFAWLGILAEVAPSSHELIYANHPDGFALLSMRSPTISRLYVQCAPDDEITNWSDYRIWEALAKRLGKGYNWQLQRGPILQRGITAMRSFVTEPLQHGRLFLAGDAAHIVPPTGAKGMNLAIADVFVLAQAIEAYVQMNEPALLETYSQKALKRVWLVQRFSWWMTSLLHKFDAVSAFDAKRQIAELDYLAASEAAQTSLAENYVGLPL